MEYKVLAYYTLSPLSDPHAEIKRHKAFLETLDSKGRIYIGEQGVNAQLSVHEKDIAAYLAWLDQSPIYREADVKLHDWHEHPFAKLTVKYRKQIVAIDLDIDMKKRASHISPAEWKRWLDERDENTIVVDVRNEYESNVGHFEGAIKPAIQTFREFPAFAKELQEKYDPKKTRVMIYCTGGIRCEFYSPVLRDAGFEQVYQLEGGVIRYGVEEGAKHWRGKLFVFDDRMVVPISEDNTETIGACLFCKTASDTFYNCANMDCNELFVACGPCAEKLRGCCCDDCLKSGRVRPYLTGERVKPFRKLPFVEKQTLTSCSCAL